MELTLGPTPPPLTWLHHARDFAHVGEYARAIHALASSTHVAPSDETTGVFCLLHPFVKVDILPFVNDFHPETKVILDQELFIFALVCPPHFCCDFRYGVRVFMILFCPRCFCKWLWPLFTSRNQPKCNHSIYNYMRLVVVCDWIWEHLQLQNQISTILVILTTMM
jgi:hypothetical protein